MTAPPSACSGEPHRRESQPPGLKPGGFVFRGCWFVMGWATYVVSRCDVFDGCCADVPGC
jgi:hypothetical protein